ncbi:MAG: redoxin domain-containing protein [Saprospiraceae bacterium]|nr:redoxin domain-containing protein [Saprospiraceae bacterium]MDZ4702439.1 redoxin domain-containing protein [Saprospiraceae bacterium]
MQRHWLQTPLLRSEKTTTPLAETFEKSKPVALIFLDSECPICQKYTKNIREFAVKYPQVQWIGVFTRWHSFQQITDFGVTYNLNIPMFLDARNRLVCKLGVKVTPEVVFAATDGHILYQGAIDNWFFGLGKHRPTSTENYLTDAIEAWSRGEAPKISRTTPIGCVIEQ